MKRVARALIPWLAGTGVWLVLILVVALFHLPPTVLQALSGAILAVMAVSILVTWRKQRKIERMIEQDLQIREALWAAGQEILRLKQRIAELESKQAEREEK